ncbi:hypothetical protein C8Q77DRAFT_324237 [Trametes polyzona]|nr:hypothetical protein C8Q77DRAFT_324237 [Trametes polyzona]
MAAAAVCSLALLSRLASISLACCAESLLAARSISVSLDYALPVDCPLRVNSPSESSPPSPLHRPRRRPRPWRTPPAPACPRNAYTRSACASRTRRHRKCPCRAIGVCKIVSRFSTAAVVFRVTTHRGVLEYTVDTRVPTQSPGTAHTEHAAVGYRSARTARTVHSHLDRCRNTVGVLVLSPVPRPFGAQLSRRTRLSLQRAADVCNPTFRAVFIARVLGAHSSPSRCDRRQRKRRALGLAHIEIHIARGYATSASYSSMHNAVSRAGPLAVKSQPPSRGTLSPAPRLSAPCPFIDTVVASRSTGAETRSVCRITPGAATFWGIAL